MEFLLALIGMQKIALTILDVITLAGLLFLGYEIRNVKRIVSNGLSNKVEETAKKVAKIEGYLEGGKHHE